MTFEEAAADPRRPLSLTPREWMYSIEAKLNEEAELTEKTAKRLMAAKKEEEKEDEIPGRSGTGIESIDLGIDQLVSGCKIIDAGLRQSEMTDMAPNVRKVIDKMKDVMETAIEPYLVDLIKLSDELDGIEPES